MKFLTRLFFRITLLPVVQILYRVRRLGVENIPKEGGVLLLGNHVSYIDSFIMYLSCPRPVRFVVLSSYVENPYFGWFLKLFGGIPIRRGSAKDAIVKTVEALQQGDLVCLFPEGELTHTGVLGSVKKGFELIARKAQCPVVPFYMDGLFNSIFSFERNRYFKKMPRGLTCPIQVAFGEPISHEEATRESLREKILQTSVTAFDARREFRQPLEIEVIKALKRNRRHSFLIEMGKSEPRDWTRGKTLALAVAMARKWMSSPPEEGDRVGILLPPGPTPAAINLGLFLAGKTPVNLPFTIDQREMEALSKSIAPLGIKTVITSKAFMPQLVDFWPGDEALFIDLKSIFSAPGPAMMLFERIRAFWEPAWLTSWRLDLKKRDLHREAVGFVPHPGKKAQLLSSRELHKSARRVTAANFVNTEEIILSETTFSRPAGLFPGLWSPLLSSGRVVSRSFSKRQDNNLLEELILHQGVTMLSGTQEFYRSIKEPLGIKSLKFGLVFGEIDPFELEDYEEKLDLRLGRCWDFGGRIVTMSCLDPEGVLSNRHRRQKGRMAKARGRLLPGIGAKIENGVLFLQFQKNGNEDKTTPVWTEAAYAAEFDEESFLYFQETARL